MPTGRIARSARIAVIPIGLAGRSLAGRIRVWRGADPLETWAQVREANADSLRDSLGALKGGALKAGQLLSTVDSLFPADPDRTWESALTQLQEANPALPFADSAGVLREEWGSAWRSRFDEFDPVPVAAASLGQVFRARWNGRDVAVKVQYPGIREAIESDVALLAWALRAGSLVARGLVVPPVIDELRSRLTDELDYVREADHQNQFAAAYADDSDVVVPRAVEATPRVLVTEWLPGSP